MCGRSYGRPAVRLRILRLVNFCSEYTRVPNLTRVDVDRRRGRHTTLLETTNFQTVSIAIPARADRAVIPFSFSKASAVRGFRRESHHNRLPKSVGKRIHPIQNRIRT